MLPGGVDHRRDPARKEDEAPDTGDGHQLQQAQVVAKAVGRTATDSEDKGLGPVQGDGGARQQQGRGQAAEPA